MGVVRSYHGLISKKLFNKVFRVNRAVNSNKRV